MNKTNTSCPLYGKPECDLLNMQSCKDCPMREESVRQTMQQDVRLYASLLPEGGLAPLFESPTCQLCREEPKGQRDGYGILDMGHREPRREVRSGFLRLKKKDPVGFIAPLQFAICKKCRMRLLVLEYLPLLAPVVLTIGAIFLVANQAVLEQMKAIWAFLPLVTVIAAILIGYIAGQLICGAVGRAYARRMYVDPTKHPMVGQMKDNGWFLLADAKRPRLVFTKKRIAQGLGSSPSGAYAALAEEIRAEEEAKAPEPNAPAAPEAETSEKQPEAETPEKRD